MTGGSHVWTDDRVEKLHQLAAEGLSTSQIAAELGNGISRNAVIGKMHRDGIESKNSRGWPGVKKPDARPRIVRKRAPRKVSTDIVVGSSKPPTPICEEAFVAGPDGGVSLFDKANDQCSWPLDNGNYCGASVTLGRNGRPVSYCRHHQDVAGRSARELGAMEERRKARQKTPRFKGYGY